MMDEGHETVEIRRLHPATLLQRLTISLPGLFFLFLPLWNAPSREVWIPIGFAALYSLIAIPLTILQYMRFRYWVTPKEIVIESGVITRRKRNIPVERITNVEIEQKLIPRLFRTARIKIETGGNAQAEGVIEFVSIEEAVRVREAVRDYRRLQAVEKTGMFFQSETAVLQDESDAAIERMDPAPLYQLSPGRTLLSGVFRFSLLYIALIFSAFQYVEVTPEEIVDWFSRGQLEPITTFVSSSPWIAGFAALFIAAMLSWITGILVSFNRLYGFTLTLKDGNLYKRHGLLTLSEGNIPIRSVQALLIRSNPVMRRFGWYRLEVKLMGFEEKQKGSQEILPFARMEEIRSIASLVYPFDLPDRLEPVSSLHRRRLIVRYSVLWCLPLTLASVFWTPALYALIFLPVWIGVALLQYQSHGYRINDETIYIGLGYFYRQYWIVPVSKMQVVETSASFFQRRMELQSLFVDVAGADGWIRPVIYDLPDGTATETMERVYLSFKRLQVTRSPVRTFPERLKKTENPPA